MGVIAAPPLHGLGIEDANRAGCIRVRPGRALVNSAAVPEGKIAEAILSLLERNFGGSPARAIDFYADTDVALADPEEYARLLLGIFGAGAGHVLGAIVSGLGQEFGVHVDEGTTLAEVLGSLKPQARA